MSDQAHGPETGATPAEEHDGENGVHVEKWEGIWMRVSVVMVVVFILAIVISATAFGIGVPGVGGRINPTTLSDPGSPFANAWLARAGARQI